LNEDIDLKAALNAISDVIQNRPRPLRDFDQIYMKAADMVFQSEYVARWADEQRLAFIGDGDSISVCVAYLKARDIIDYGPARIRVFDFDERMVSAINRFADSERLDNLEAQLYNCLDQFPDGHSFDFFYTNPPWGASNDGRSVNLFTKRGFEAVSYQGEGLVVIADDRKLEWPQHVLANVQEYAAEHGFYVSRMQPELHLYHLDDNPELKSCNLTLRSRPGNQPRGQSEPMSDPDFLEHFYGQDQPPRVRYVRERKRLDYGKAHDDEYSFDYYREEGSD
jgi:predicted methyltransferase